MARWWGGVLDSGGAAVVLDSGGGAVVVVQWWWWWWCLTVVVVQWWWWCSRAQCSAQSAMQPRRARRRQQRKHDRSRPHNSPPQQQQHPLNTSTQQHNTPSTQQHHHTKQIIHVNLTQHDNATEPVKLEAGAKVAFTYAVTWTPTATPFDRRFEKYLDYSFFEHKVRFKKGGYGTALCVAGSERYEGSERHRAPPLPNRHRRPLTSLTQNPYARNALCITITITITTIT